MLLLIGHAEEGDPVPDAVTQPAARECEVRAVVANDSVLDVLSDRLGAGLDGRVERALGVDQRRIAFARHRPLRLHRHLSLGGQSTLAVEPVGGDEEGGDGDEK